MPDRVTADTGAGRKIFREGGVPTEKRPKNSTIKPLPWRERGATEKQKYRKIALLSRYLLKSRRVTALLSSAADAHDCKQWKCSY